VRSGASKPRSIGLVMGPQAKYDDIRPPRRLAGLEVRVSLAGSAKAAWHPATAQQAAGTRIWSPMTQRPVIATG
jgi:hypothetical protein